MDFFGNKPASIFDLFQTTFQIFWRGWKTFLSVYFLVNFLGFISGFGIGMGLAIAQYELKVALNIAQVCDCFWSSIFEGAINQVVATIYIGGDPCYKRSFKKGWSKKWTLFEYYLVVMLLQEQLIY
ncbi:predicted protein [Chaetoceros tenuissimus]|uniref:Uncharacterized protein n=1 Tax=Chaetoceros tenuissimus TaxID=426638 RepID=A0AAD3H9T3_9STRA|nr:predicted protein [Chaetoceros tenuissimus]